MREGARIKIIEWNDLSKSSFYMYGFGFSFASRCLIYPSQLIKTRLQSQPLCHKTGKPLAYKGLEDAMRKIYKTEGVRGFYKGLHLNLVQIPMQQMYLTIFEAAKQQLSSRWPNGNLNLQYMAAGAIASSATQVVATPLDVVTQYQQVSNAKSIEKNKNITAKNTMKVCSQLYRSDGIRGFYRGFSIATLCFSIHSAIIWSVYYQFLEFTATLFKSSPSSPSTLNTTMTSNHAIQIMISGSCASGIVGMLTLPMDTVRTRHQLQLKRKVSSKAQPSVYMTTKVLWRSEGWKGLFRGWSPRLAQSITTSGLLFLGYEYLKIVAYRAHLEKKKK